MLTRVGLSQEFAEALVELIACVASGRVSPRGDREVAGATKLDDILPELVAAAA
jgi:hypothetical protein